MTTWVNRYYDTIIRHQNPNSYTPKSPKFKSCQLQMQCEIRVRALKRPTNPKPRGETEIYVPIYPWIAYRCEFSIVFASFGSFVTFNGKVKIITHPNGNRDAKFQHVLTFLFAHSVVCNPARFREPQHVERQVNQMLKVTQSPNCFVVKLKSICKPK